MLGLKFVDKSAVEKELEKEQKEHKQKQKKAKKEAKKKKDKYKKRERKDAGSSDASQWHDGGGTPIREVATTEAPAPAPASAPREKWMAMDFSAMSAPNKEVKKEPEVAPGQQYAPGLNVLAGGGDGAVAVPTLAAAATSGPALVGDGGRSWRMRALRRAQEQAKQEGAELAEVVRQRWDSVAELVESATARPPTGQRGQARSGDRVHKGPRGSDRPAPHYLQDVGSFRNQMRMPQVDHSLSWRPRGSRSHLDDPDDQTWHRHRSGREASTSGKDRVERDEIDDRKGYSREDYDRECSCHDSRATDSGAGYRSGSADLSMDGGDRRRECERNGTNWNSDDGDGNPRNEDLRDPEARREVADRSRVDRGEDRGDRVVGRGDRGNAGGNRGEDRGNRPNERGDRGDGRGNMRERSGGRKQEWGSEQRGRAGRWGSARQPPGWQQGQECGGSQSEDNKALLKTAAAAINEMPNDGSFMDRFQKLQRVNQELKDAIVAGKDPFQGDGSPQDDASDRRREGQEGGEHRDKDRPGSPTSAATSSEPPSNQDVATLLRERLKKGLKTKSLQDLPLSTAARPPGPIEDHAPDRAGGDSAAAGGAGFRGAAAALRNKLLAARKEVAPGQQGSRPPGAEPHTQSSDDDGVEILPLVDQEGRAMPGAFGRALQLNAPGDRGKSKVQRYGEDGKRKRYFKDDDNVDLETLVKRAKYGDDSIAGVDEALARSIMTSNKFKETELDADAEYDLDAGLDRIEDRRKRGTREQQMLRERSRQISQHRKVQSLEESCHYCFKSQQRPQHLTVAIAQTTYLGLMEKGHLAPDHCYIAPLEHIASTCKVDDHSWTEIRNFQKCLIRMFMEQGKETIFMETAVGLNTYRHHGVMECIPVDREVMAKAPLYFKKGIDEAESEWSQHHAKRLIQTREKGLRGSIPPNFPYFYVQFGYSDGYVHVIDDESKWDLDFGRQILVGLMKLPAEEMHRRQRAGNINAQQLRAAEFSKNWETYDWTKQLEG